MPRSADTSTAIEIKSTPGIQTDIDVAWLRDHLARALLHLNRPAARIGITLINDVQMTDLHKQHLGLNTTTDVLTFPMSDAGEPLDVDMALCVNEASRQAAQH